MVPIKPSRFAPQRTADEISDPARLDIEDRLSEIAYQGRAAIARRLAELDREWTAGRVAKVVMATGILTGISLTVAISPWWLLLPGSLALVLLQHAISRECWMTQAFKQFGLRSAIEIEHERWALKAIRGDFRHLPTVCDRTDEEAISRLEDEGGIPAGPVCRPEQNRAAVKEVLELVEARR